MALPCENAKEGRGIFVEVRSSDRVTPICILGQRTDVQHIIKVKNLMLYPANIACEGSIRAHPRRVKFLSPFPGDTESTWKASKWDLGDWETYSFVSATLLPESPVIPGAIEKVDATVSITRPLRPAPAETVRLTIDVTV